jgi:hypothetical protein
VVAKAGLAATSELNVDWSLPLIGAVTAARDATAPGNQHGSAVEQRSAI